MKIGYVILIAMMAAMIYANDGDVILSPNTFQCSIGLTLLNSSYVNLSQFNNDVGFWNSCSNASGCGFISSESDPLYASNNASIARIGSCSDGYAVQNTTISGVDCILMPTGGSSGNPFDQSLNTTDDVMFHSINSTSDLNVSSRIYTSYLNVSKTIEVKGNVTALQYFGQSTTTAKPAFATRDAVSGWGGTLAGALYYISRGNLYIAYYPDTDTRSYGGGLGQLQFYNNISYFMHNVSVNEQLEFSDTDYYDTISFRYGGIADRTFYLSSRNGTDMFSIRNFTKINISSALLCNASDCYTFAQLLNQSDLTGYAKYQFTTNNFNGSGNITASNYYGTGGNITGNFTMGGQCFYHATGACDLTKNGSQCTNTTDTYIIGGTLTTSC